MAKLILSGDLSIFRIEMVVRILEALKFDGEVALEAIERGTFFMLQGKVVGARNAMNEGMAALVPMVSQRVGTFSVRQLSADEVTRHPDLAALPDNAAIFRQVHALLGQGRFATVPAAQPAAPAASAQPSAPPAAPAASAQPSAPPAAPAATPSPRPRPAGGPLARVPEVTDKGKVTLRSIQTNFALRGVQVDADTWRILAKVDGQQNLFAISEMVNVAGDRFNQAVEQLLSEGYIRFQVHDPTLEQLTKRTESKFRFGEYMVAKGVITEVQLEGALRRQQELARRGRYMWLGEILIEMNYARPSHVQEALAVQKRMGG
ncbi:hypothetical protein J7643_06705 [bacterium]|nr:hypothetical protein [bacterium]